MKLLLLSFEFPPLIGGAGSFSSELAKGLSELDHNIEILTGLHFPKHETNEFDTAYLQDNKNIRLTRVKFLGKLYYLQMIIILILRYNRILSKNFDLIILSDLKSIIFSSIFFRQKLLKKTVIVLHGSEINKFFINPSAWLRFSKLNIKIKNNFSKIKIVFTVSNFLKDELLKTIDVPENMVKVIRHGVDITKFKPFSIKNDRTKFREKLGFDKNNIVFASASRIIKEKGQDFVISAFQEIYRENMHSRLLIIGDGDYLNNLKTLVKENELEEVTKFTGAVSREIIGSYFSASDVFILPTRIKNEAYGLVYIEANACGIPAIGSIFGGAKEAILNDQNGLTINPLSKEDIVKSMQLMLNKDIREKFSKNALAFGQENNNINMAKYFIEQIKLLEDN